MAFRVHLGHVVFALGALGFVACATILGIDDRRLDTQDASTNPSMDGSADTSRDASADAPVGSDTSTGDQGAPDGAVREGGSDADASSAADGPATDAPSMDARSTDGPNSDAQGDGGSCLDPCVLATGLNHPFLMTSDTNNVYWTEFGDFLGSANGSVKACPVTGCPPSGPLVYAPAQTNARGIAVDSQNVYWATASYGGVTGGIWSCPLTGSNCSPMALAAAGIPYGVAVDPTYVYWVDNSDYTVHRELKGGGTDNVLYDAGSGVSGAGEQCAVDSTFVFFTDNNDSVYRVAVGGGDPVTIATGSRGGGWPVAIDPSNVYFGVPGQIVSAAKGSTEGGAPIAGGIPDPVGLVFDPTTSAVYWSDWGTGSANDGTVGKVWIDGGGKVVLAASLVTPEAVTVSGNYVFWLSNGILDDAGVGTVPRTGALLRRAK